MYGSVSIRTMDITTADVECIVNAANSTGVYGYPLRPATEIACQTVADWLSAHPDSPMAVLFACFDDRTSDVYREVWGKLGGSYVSERTSDPF